MRHHLKAVLFDLDGVLVDTEGIYTEFWSSIDRLYPTGVENFALAIKGNTLVNVLNTHFPGRSVQAEIVRLLEEHERTMTYALMPGAIDLLHTLKDAGVGTAIVTSSSPRKMRNLFDSLPELEQCIDALVTDADVSRGKPDPEGYLKGAARLDADPADCVVVEDSLAGLEAGMRSGARVLGLSTTNPAERLQGHAHEIRAGLHEVSVALLEGMFK